MTRKVILTLPALLVGPALVLLVQFTVYDWTVTGAAFTALAVSAAAVHQVWKRDGETQK